MVSDTGFIECKMLEELGPACETCNHPMSTLEMMESKEGLLAGEKISFCFYCHAEEDE